ncbi:MAG: serine hydrolase, partial [Alistipes sp.]|nr:serine hydrolase [Alistipes sp.]
MRRSFRKFFGLALCLAGVIVCLVQCAPAVDMTDEGALPRAKATTELDKAFGEYLAAVEAAGQDLHSIMIVKDGKVVKEHWMGEGAPDKLHILNSVSKTFTSTAVGLAIAEGKLSLSDKVVDLFPDKLPTEVSDNLKKVEVRHLLTMSGGHDTEPSRRTMPEGADWVEAFLAHPFEHEPGTYFWYNSMGTYMLSAIVQKVTGEKVIDYLTPRLFEPLAIEGATWQESPQGINVGGWGLYLKTEDLAK